MRRIGVMGGTFDPVHHGHLVAASEVAHIFALDEVIFVPTGQPYQKEYRIVSAAEDRYLMTVIATASNPRFSVSRVDIDRPGPDLHHRHAARPARRGRAEDELFFITGADALAEILTWHDVDELFTPGAFRRLHPARSPAVGGRACPTARSAWWRSRRWPSPPPSAAPGSRRASRSGTWSRTAWCSTSPSAGLYAKENVTGE